MAEIPITDRNGVRGAVERAAKVQPDWAALSPAARAKSLISWRKAIVKDSDQLTRTLSRENGKPLHEAWLHELAPLCDSISWLAQEAPKLLADQPITLRWMKQYKSVVSCKPRGHCAIISPYNFPMLIPFADAAAALVAGCSVIVKPSEHTPLTALAIAQLAYASGLEPGLLQVLPGGPLVARTLIESGVDEVIFTGNLAHGREVARLCADRLLPCTLELGGNAPALVLEDVDVDSAASAIVFGALANSGQNCIAVERVLVHTKVHRALVDAIVDRVRHLRQGDPLLAEVDLGALTSQFTLGHVKTQIDAAISGGAKLTCGGVVSRAPGNFMSPTVLDECTPDMSITAEETFGPVISIVPVESQNQGLALANRGQSGLAAYLFGRNEQELQAVAQRLNAGHILMNDVLWSYVCPEVPFGGQGHSGWGVVHGAEGLRAHTRPIHKGSPRFKVPESFGLGFPYSKAPRALLGRALRLFTR
jgi:succinate-semialdehyde dehydrogenase/glutarate-semialdehyde dehydrogenase